MGRKMAFAYSVAAYLVFFATFCYLVAFVGNFFVPKSVDVGGAMDTPLAMAILINLGLVGLFAVQHTIMARPGFKAWWTQFVPKSIERSTFVLFASACFIILFWQWRPMGGVLWNVEHAGARAALIALSLSGWGILLVTSYLINHFHLFGLQQGWETLRKGEAGEPKFQTPSLYRLCRHPMMTGVMIAIWATPTMTVGHLVFAMGFTAYILVGIQFEERDLVRQFGNRYEQYRRTTPMLIPRLGVFGRPAAGQAAA